MTINAGSLVPANPAGGSEGGLPPPPSLPERLAWDTEKQGDLPEDLRSVSLDDVKALLTERESASAETARAAAEAEYARQQADEHQRVAQTAAVQEDIRYYEDLRGRRNAADDAVRTTAEAEFRANEDRYIRGASAQREQQSVEQQNRVLAAHYQPLFADLAQKGHEGFISALKTLLPKHGNNTLLAAIEYGRLSGETAALERGRQEGARAERIRLGSEGAPDLSGGNPVATPNYGDPAWVKAQMDKDPDWLSKKTADSQETNLQRATSAGALKKATAMLRGNS